MATKSSKKPSTAADEVQNPFDQLLQEVESDEKALHDKRNRLLAGWAPEFVRVAEAYKRLSEKMPTEAKAFFESDESVKQSLGKLGLMVKPVDGAKSKAGRKVGGGGKTLTFDGYKFPAGEFTADEYKKHVGLAAVTTRLKNAEEAHYIERLADRRKSTSGKGAGPIVYKTLPQPSPAK